MFSLPTIQFGKRSALTLAGQAALLLSIISSAPLRATEAVVNLPDKASLIPDLERENLTALAQGNRGVCSLFAITGLAEFESIHHGGGPHQRLSEEYLIWASRKFSGNADGQAMFYNATDGLESFGLCSEERMPYAADSDPARTPSTEAVAEAERLRGRWRVQWIKRWSLDARLDDAQLREIRQALAGGHPVACGLRWPKKLHGSQLLDVPKAEEVFDGHSIMFVGYEDDPAANGGGILRFRNSFGPDWGEHGYGAMSYGYAAAYANDALWLQIEPAGSEIPAVRYEAEELVISGEGKCSAHAQQMIPYGKQMWSGGAQLFCRSEKDGYVDLEFVVPSAGRYRLRMLATAAPDYGQVQVVLDDTDLPPQFDLYSGRVCPAGSLELGEHEFSAGRHRLRVKTVGKNEVSKGFCFGLDVVDLLRTD